ncbi:MAG: flagellar basal body-associated FliL family protein [Nocardioides sp.]
MSQTVIEPTDEEAPAGRGKKGKVLVVLLVLVLAGVGAWWFMLRPASAEEAPHPGAVVKLDAIQVNLADGHYLRIGVALQATDEVKEELEGSKALDATIELFTGQDMDRLAQRPYREGLRKKLVHRLEEAYEGEVMGVYFTDFVTQ